MEKNLRIETEEGKYIFVEELDWNLVRCLTNNIDINKDINEKVNDLDMYWDLDKVITDNLPPYLGMDVEYDEEEECEGGNPFNIHTIMGAVRFIENNCRYNCYHRFYIKEGFKLEDYLPSCAKRIDRYIYNVYETRLIAPIKQIKKEKLSVDEAIELSYLDGFWSLEEAENYKKERVKDVQNYDLLLSNREKTLPKEIRDELNKLVIKKMLFTKDVLSCEICEKIK